MFTKGRHEILYGMAVVAIIQVAQIVVSFNVDSIDNWKHWLTAAIVAIVQAPARYLIANYVANKAVAAGG